MSTSVTLLPCGTKFRLKPIPGDILLNINLSGGHHKSPLYKNNRHQYLRLYIYSNMILLAGSFILASAPGHALQIRFKDRDILFFVDSTLTASAAMRTQTGQQGTASGNRSIFPDGGDIYSTPLSLITDISASKNGMGVFARASYIYDPTILGRDCTNCQRPTPQMGANGIASSAQHLAGNKFRLLDMFVFNTWHFGEHPLNLKVGKQVISWGESNIIGGGISQMQTLLTWQKQQHQAQKSKKP